MPSPNFSEASKKERQQRHAEDVVTPAGSQLNALNSRTVERTRKAIVYLQEFGYLAKQKVKNAADLNEPLHAAIHQFQKHSGLDMTGVLNDETSKRMEIGRCAFPDFDDPIGAIATGPWERKNLTFGFGSFGKMENQISPEELKLAIRRAFSTWALTGVGLTFQEKPISENPDIKVEGKPAADPDRNMEAGQVAHSDLPPHFSLIHGSPPLPLHFDESEKWSLAKEALCYDVESIALHEIGHCLGLLHSSSSADVLYSFVYPNQLKRTLSKADLEQLTGLYPI